MKLKFALLLALCGLFSCSDDETLPTNETTPPTGLFVAVNDVELFIVDIRDGQCYQFTVWMNDGTRFYAQGFATSGKWPKYEYNHTGKSDGQFTMSATFLNESAFAADFNAHLVMQEMGWSETGRNMTLTIDAKDYVFTLQNEPLDANGDGVPDTFQ